MPQVSKLTLFFFLKYFKFTQNFVFHLSHIFNTSTGFASLERGRHMINILEIFFLAELYA